MVVPAYSPTSGCTVPNAYWLFYSAGNPAYADPVRRSPPTVDNTLVRCNAFTIPVQGRKVGGFNAEGVPGDGRCCVRVASSARNRLLRHGSCAGSGAWVLIVHGASPDRGVPQTGCSRAASAHPSCTAWKPSRGGSSSSFLKQRPVHLDRRAVHEHRHVAPSPPRARRPAPPASPPGSTVSRRRWHRAPAG